VTGGGRGTRAIAAHFRYISKNGKLEIEDEQELALRGRSSVRELVEEWRYGGALIPEEGRRREAFNIILSMPAGTSASALKQAARQFARTEFSDHKYVMVLHEHQANPHMHLSVRAESTSGRRLNPRKEDLRRWRELFAYELRSLGIDAEASTRATRGVTQRYPSLWEIKALGAGRLRRAARSAEGPGIRSGYDAGVAWGQIAAALAASPVPEDLALARSVALFLKERFVPPPDLGRRADASDRSQVSSTLSR
jgi:hypothetical protein